MIDNRILTFLKLCEVKNYRKTAEELNMTQPGVTQHIHFLESRYGCKLFIYKDRKLCKTKQGEALERHARSTVYNDTKFKAEIIKPQKRKIAIGATKTIGEYLLCNKVIRLLKNDDLEVEIVIDNTEHLLKDLNELQLDLLMVEGCFDKKDYGVELMHNEELVGICSINHPFAGRSVSIEELMKEHIILRENGSGTRFVFENFLQSNNYTVGCFEKRTILSNFTLINRAVAENIGVSFVYECATKSNPLIATFHIQNVKITHEFNYVYLQNANASSLIKMLKA